MNDLVPSKPWKQPIIFGKNNLPILCEASHTLNNKYERPNFYRDDPLYSKIKLITLLNEWDKISPLRYVGQFTRQVTGGAAKSEMLPWHN
jgi:hypothetical protein